MYVGRFVVVAPGVGAYRVSSRSFPNRRVVDRDGTLTVAPTPDAPETDNPYVSYNCLRPVETPTGRTLVALGNGSHVDPIAEKLELGYPARDALADPLLALDYEKDDYDTPRIAGVVGSDEASVGIVRRD
ncbi:IMP cyclohydrolase, partial [Halobium palmae]